MLKLLVVTACCLSICFSGIAQAQKPCQYQESSTVTIGCSPTPDGICGFTISISLEAKADARVLSEKTLSWSFFDEDGDGTLDHVRYGYGIGTTQSFYYGSGYARALHARIEPVLGHFAEPEEVGVVTVLQDDPRDPFYFGPPFRGSSGLAMKSRFTLAQRMWKRYQSGALTLPLDPAERSELQQAFFVDLTK